MACSLVISTGHKTIGKKKNSVYFTMISRSVEVCVLVINRNQEVWIHIPLQCWFQSVLFYF